jgi:hypothetical protein
MRDIGFWRHGLPALTSHWNFTVKGAAVASIMGFQFLLLSVDPEIQQPSMVTPRHARGSGAILWQPQRQRTR